MSIINFKTEEKIKEDAQRIAQQMGLNLSDVLNICLRNFIRDKELNISLEEPSPYMLKELSESEKNIEEGDVSPEFDNAKEAINWLNRKK
ncbi:MAG: type II toxin-antitoxin system RelB/DinJ family antitoxin [Candidatus Pacebacteria bacterium]|jgi:addiction module RelB/DinJ family antitoxin|nr:type II toxin-antitoxin system RelB/DinJ family antitoxin [Candidatus Paceibacterota bacterium]MDD5013078.1 type II toxin-antitoxin system RelB/DinJ family antitoxin [Candidatus Paceibacterota bacterium]MDD5753089.1 type II toxin-antitoxin system RelB/DinJ family antitoxin [Candidatus Paceibacterota bacterium]